MAELLVLGWTVELHDPSAPHMNPYEQHPPPSDEAHLKALISVQLRGQHAVVTDAVPLTVVVDWH